MRKTYRFVVLSLLLVLGMLASSCAQPAAAPSTAPGEPTAAGAKPAPAGKVKIRATVWLGEEELEALNKLTAEYLKTHENIEVEWINIVGGGPYGRDKLQTMIAGGDAPDLMMLNTGQFEGFAARGALMELDQFVQQENYDLSIYWPEGIDGCKYNGKLYGLPRDLSDVILFYNKDLFDKAGVAYPSEDWTWDDLLEAAQTLTIDKDGDGKIDQWGFGVDNYVYIWAGFVWANGGEVLSADRKQCLLNEPKALEAMQFYYDLQTKYQVSPPPGALPEQAWSGDWMLSESVAMMFAGPWWRPALVTKERPFKWDVAHPPKSPATGKRASVVYTDQWSIYSGSKVAAQAWDFMKFLTGQEAQQMWTDLIGARSISPVKAVAETDKWLHYGGSTGEIILDTLSISKAPPVNFGNANEAEMIWDQELSLVISGDQTVPEAVKKICDQIAPVLADSQ